jgi:hypothetical protein
MPVSGASSNTATDALDDEYLVRHARRCCDLHNGGASGACLGGVSIVDQQRPPTGIGLIGIALLLVGLWVFKQARERD